MVRTQSLLIRNGIFGAACAVLVAVLVFRGEGTRLSDDTAGLGPAFGPISVDKVQSIEIEQTTKVDGKPVKEGVKLVRSSKDAWKLASSFDYAADNGKIESYLKTLKDVRRHAEPTSNPDKFAEFAGPEGFVEVRVFESDAAPSISFGIGKATSDGSYTKKFVRVDDAAPSKAARVLVVSGLDMYGSPTSPTNWIETRLLPSLSGADVAELVIEQGEAHRQVAFARAKKKDAPPKDGKDNGGKDAGGKDSGAKSAEDTWEMTAPTAEPALSEPVMALVRAFVGMTLSSIEAGKTTPADDAKYGFDKPDLVIRGSGKMPADLGPTPTWTIRIGKKVEGKSTWYARRSTGDAVDPYVFTVNDYDLTDFRKEPATWLEKKPEPPAPPPGAVPAPAMEGDTAAMGGETPAMGAETPAMGDAPPTPATPPTPVAPAMGDAPATPPAMGDVPAVPPGMDAPPPTPATGAAPAPEPSKPPGTPDASKGPVPPK